MLADLNNIGSAAGGGSCTAAAFLKVRLVGLGAGFRGGSGYVRLVALVLWIDFPSDFLLKILIFSSSLCHF